MDTGTLHSSFEGEWETSVAAEGARDELVADPNDSGREAIGRSWASRWPEVTATEVVWLRASWVVETVNEWSPMVTADGSGWELGAT